MKELLELQALDLKIESCKAREKEIPRQKERFDIHKKRLADELAASEERCKALALEQRECEGDIEQKQAQIAKYDTQLLAVKKNTEYQSLLHEIDGLKKQIGLKEERIITVMVESDEAAELLEADKKRIDQELKGIEEECKKVDEELAVAIRDRKELESQRGPILDQIERGLLSRYERIRRALKHGPAVVVLNGESCSGCFMAVTAQAVNEILAGTQVHACRHCGRLLYHADTVTKEEAESA